MRLRIFLPTEVMVDETVSKVIAEAENGYFCLEPRHVDIVNALAPGLLTYVTSAGEERFVGVDEGVLVKCGPDVRGATRDAVTGDEPAALKRAMLTRSHAALEHERKARTVLARLEAGVAKRFLDMQKGG